MTSTPQLNAKSTSTSSMLVNLTFLLLTIMFFLGLMNWPISLINLLLEYSNLSNYTLYSSGNNESPSLRGPNST